MPHATVAGHPTYYEVDGDGPDVVLLHGALSGADAWVQQTPALVAAGYRVWRPERRGHGHTADTDEPFHYASMAEETIAFLDEVVGGGAAHLVGWSDGAIVAAIVSMRRPGLVDRQILIGQYFNDDGRIEGGLVPMLAQFRDDPPAFLAGNYGEQSPDGIEHFPVVYAKTVDMILAEPHLTLDEFAAVPAPTLVLQGDRDDVLLEHSAAVAGALPEGRLAVLPGSHLLPIESPELVNALIVAWLAGSPEPPAWASDDAG